jgi:hypothetical protein
VGWHPAVINTEKGYPSRYVTLFSTNGTHEVEKQVLVEACGGEV